MGDADGVELTQNRNKWRALVKVVMTLWFS